jgi:hypothetical protein
VFPVHELVDNRGGAADKIWAVLNLDEGSQVQNMLRTCWLVWECACAVWHMCVGGIIVFRVGPVWVGGWYRVALGGCYRAVWYVNI